LDDFANAFGTQPFTFNNLPVGSYNLVLFGVNGGWHGNKTTFTVNGVSKSTTNTTDASFIEGDNYVVFSNIVVTTGTLTGTWRPAASGEGNLNGAQLQFLGPVAPSVTLYLQRASGGQLQLQWSQGTLLETATLVTGPWTPVPGAASPYTLSTTGSQKFYRVQVSP
jgi:hypothetical protein